MSLSYISGSSAGGTGGDLVVNAPAGIQDGDILFASTYREGGGWTLPAGWAWLAAEQTAPNAAACIVRVCWKRCSGEPGSYTFQTATTTRIVAISAFRGGKSGTPFDTPVSSAIAQLAVQAASVTTSFDNAMVLVGMGNFGGTDITAASSGMTLGPGLTGCEVFYVIQGSAGASGTKTFSNSGASGDWVCFTTDLWEDTGSPAIRPYLSDNIKFQLFLRN